MRYVLTLQNTEPSESEPRFPSTWSVAACASTLSLVAC